MLHLMVVNHTSRQRETACVYQPYKLGRAPCLTGRRESRCCGSGIRSQVQAARRPIHRWRNPLGRTSNVSHHPAPATVDGNFFERCKWAGLDGSPRVHQRSSDPESIDDLRLPRNQIVHRFALHLPAQRVRSRSFSVAFSRASETVIPAYLAFPLKSFKTDRTSDLVVCSLLKQTRFSFQINLRFQV